MDVLNTTLEGRSGTAVDEATHLAGREVVVGFDATPAAHAAVRWAAVEAARLGSPLTVVCVVDLGALDSGRAAAPELARLGRELATRGAEVARAAAPEAPAPRVVGTIGGAAGELVARSASAGLLVVGAPRVHGAAVLGSVSFGVTLHARCPVVLVPEDPERVRARRAGPVAGGDVVVGVDGSRSSRSAVQVAAELAVAEGGSLRLVTAWQPASVLCPAVQDPQGARLAAEKHASATRQAAAQHEVTAVVEQLRRDLPGLEVSGAAVEGTPLDVLTSSAADASLLVVGSRGHGGFAGLALGSVSHAVVRSARVPVAVVRQGWW